MFEYRAIRKKLQQAHVWSNVFFFAPVVVALGAGLDWFAWLIFVVMFVSLLFHLSKHRDWGVSWLSKGLDKKSWLTQRLLWLDTILGFFVLCAEITLLVDSRFDNVFAWLAVISGIMAGLVFWAEFHPVIRKELGYSRSHAVWHFWSAITAVMVVLAVAF